jgi:hypothetical protein
VAEALTDVVKVSSSAIVGRPAPVGPLPAKLANSVSSMKLFTSLSTPMRPVIG